MKTFWEKSTMASSSSNTLHTQKSTLQKTDIGEPSLPFLEISMDMRSKQLAPFPQHNHRRQQSHSGQVYSSRNSTSTSPLLSTTQSIYQSPSSSLSYSFLVLSPSKSFSLISSPPILHTNKAIHQPHHIQDTFITTKTIIPTATATTESSPLPSSSSS
ncbi:unnamed protein product [Absidia cylindrospora]